MAGPARHASHPDYSSSGDAKFIPEIWSGKLVTKFYDTTVFGEIASTDYQGEIKSMGDNVIIRRRAPITIRPYVIGAGLQREKPVSTATSLPIDQAEYFNFELNDVDRYQSDMQLMDEFTDEATEQMQQVIDRKILGNIYGDVAAENAGTSAGVRSGDYNLGEAGAPVVLNKGNVTDFIVDLGTVLGEQSVPRTGRWLVIPEWMSGMIQKSELKDASLAGDGTSILRNGRIGMIGSFTIYVSNNLAMANDAGAGGANVTNIIAGHKAGLTWASQMTEMEQIDNPDDFGKLVRGLNVYGYKVIEPKYLVHGYVAKA